MSSRGPQLLIPVDPPRAETDHTLRKDGNLAADTARGELSHAAAGSFSGRNGSAGEGSGGGTDGRSGSRAGPGRRIGSTMIGTDFPGKVITGILLPLPLSNEIAETPRMADRPAGSIEPRRAFAPTPAAADRLLSHPLPLWA